MPAKLTRHQILLFPGDYERLGELYVSRRAAEVIRTLVRKHIELIEQRLEERKSGTND